MFVNTEDLIQTLSDRQDYIDSMEGATLSGRQASAYICNAGEDLVALRKNLAASVSRETPELLLPLSS